MASDILLWLAMGNVGLCVYVFTILFLGLRRIRKLRDVAVFDDRQLPRVSVVVPARNEEKNIQTALLSLLNLAYKDLELIVVDDRSTDATAEILDKMAAKDPRLTVLHIEELPSGWLGKNHAMQFGSERASGEMILFTDADVVMEPDVLSRAVTYMLDAKIDHLPMMFRVKMPHWLLESMGLTFMIYLMTYLRPWNCPSPASRSYVGIGGFNLIRTEVYRKIGRHESIRLRPDDDLKLGKIVKKHGFKQEMLDAIDGMYVPWYESIREMTVGLEKNAFAGTEYRIWFTILAIGSILSCNVFPYVAVGITSGLTWWLYVAVILLLGLICVMAANFSRSRYSCCLGFPLAALILAGITTRTLFVNVLTGGIRWRDTIYSLKELKENRV